MLTSAPSVHASRRDNESPRISHYFVPSNVCTCGYQGPEYAPKFELVNPRAAAGSPNFRVQLDDGDPVLTTSTEHTFTGLSAGSHTVTVTLVDANETPIAGSRAEVGFVMLAPAPTTGTASVSGAQADVLRPAAPARPRLLLASADRGQQGEELPASGSALPLLSVIGFGVLLGGIASALKTR